ncbi:uncharacterized protein LOC126996027 isoform X3 [Eriocheir sinensis]|uniref:uncharacterized protein LOC126996027 isoform X3 n=1 Tax=Eriocheir sinensis TaxID=95602 RepID=UPI0021C97357|nr:uncharacterized protein LOC126996027 isoform X3 [Eriocheir sinensis]
MHRVKNSERLNLSCGTPTASSRGVLPWRGRDRHTAHTLAFGTPGYPSPLDRLRLRRKATQSPSWGKNASFSHVPRRHHPLEDPKHRHLRPASTTPLHHTVSTPRLTAMPGDGLHSFSYSPRLVRGSFHTHDTPTSGLTPHQQRPTPAAPLPGYWLFRSYVGGGGGGGAGGCAFPSSIFNPNKAVLTLDASTRILTANDMCSLLLGEAEEKLCGGSRRLTDFISCPATARYLASLAPDIPEEEMITVANSLTSPPLPTPQDPAGVTDFKGGVVFSGRVVSVETGENGSQLCSLWLKGLPREAGQEQRWVAVLEPIEITQAKATVDYSGAILEHDEAFRTLFGIPEALHITHLDDIHNVIPSLQLPPTPASSSSSPPLELEQQQCTGVSVEGSDGSFPLCVQVSQHTPDPSTPAASNTPALDLDILVFSNISGLVVLDAAGNITDYNYNFTHFLFGYGQGELEKKSITHLIPTFYEDMGQGQEFAFEDEVSTGSYWEEEKEETEESERQTTTRKEAEDVQNENEKVERQGKSPKPAPEQNKPSNNTINTTTTAATTPHTQAMRDITNSLNSVDLKPQQCLYNTWVDDKGMEGEVKPSVVGGVITSTPSAPSKRCPPNARPPVTTTITIPIEQGTFFGTGRHRDGSDLRLIYQIRRVEVEDNDEKEEEISEKELNKEVGEGRTSTYYYMWILNDKDGMMDDAPSTLDLTRASLHDTTEPSLGHAIARKAQQQEKQQQEEEDEQHKQKNRKNKKKTKEEEEEEDDEAGDETVDSSYCPSFSSSSECEGDGEDLSHSQTCTDGSSGAEYSLNHSRRGRHSSASAPDGERELQEEGEYSQHYRVLKQIGKGAFGCVKLAYRYSDTLMVVTKFIKKSKVYRDSWVDDMLLGRRVPLEVSLLMSLDHPNIVNVLDVFENDDYFQLVMEKLGSGMDLFEFIDRNPRLDEFLAAHIFRQIVAALTYLHSLNIIHRDVKDENVIMDNRFHVKLIDFGSSAFTSPGKEFSQFAGTVEYCSPEVLMGNKYTGYEVEVWSLGVTLYTLMYWENPFYDVDEIIKGVLNIPYEHSTELTSLLKGMMEKDIQTRLTLAQVEQHPWTQLPCNPESYVFHRVVPCTKMERNPKHYLKDYLNLTNDDIANSSSFLDEDGVPTNRAITPMPTSPYQSFRRTTSATTPRRPTHSGITHERLWSANPLSMHPPPEEGNLLYCRTPSVTCSTHSRASTAHSLSSIKSTITVDSASFSGPSSSSPSCSSATPSSATSPSTTPTTATASEWANTQLKSACASSTCQGSSTPLSDSTPSSD